MRLIEPASLGAEPIPELEFDQTLVRWHRSVYECALVSDREQLVLGAAGAGVVFGCALKDREASPH